MIAELKYRILFVVAGIAIILVYLYYPCIVLDLTEAPLLLKGIPASKEILIVYGEGLCMSCPVGQYIYSIRNRDDIVFIAPGDFNKDDVDNFREVFEVRGDIIIGDSTISGYIKKINNCLKGKTIHENLLIKLKPNGKIEYVKPL